MYVQITVRGNALCLHRECVSLHGVNFKFYYLGSDGERTTIQAVGFDTKHFSESRKRFFLKTVRGYVARIARKHKHDPIEADEDLEVDDEQQVCVAACE